LAPHGNERPQEGIFLMKRWLGLLAFAVLPMGISPAAAVCNVNEIQRVEMRNNICSGADALAAVRGCTAVLMRGQVADQFEQIALAKRCGFDAEAGTLQSYYTKTTPLVVQLYTCVDDPITQSDIEKQAQGEVDKKLAAMTPGCPEDLKTKMHKRLPTLISADQKSLQDVKRIVDQLNQLPLQ
jgi:hypothetical protein